MDDDDGPLFHTAWHVLTELGFAVGQASGDVEMYDNRNLFLWGTKEIPDFCRGADFGV